MKRTDAHFILPAALGLVFAISITACLPSKTPIEQATEVSIAFPYSFVVTADGGQVVAGNIQAHNLAVARIEKLNTDQSPNKDFNEKSAEISTRLQQEFYETIFFDIAIQADGNIVAAGYGSTYDPSNFMPTEIIVVRFLTTGEMDQSFGNGGLVRTDLIDVHPSTSLSRAYAKKIQIQSDGKILVMAYSDWTSTGNISGSGVQLALARYNMDGSLDSGFGTNGVAIAKYNQNINSLDSSLYGQALALAPSGKIVVGAFSFNASGNIADGNDRFTVLRFNANGSPDNAFGSGGLFRLENFYNVMTHSKCYSMFVQADESILAGGENQLISGNWVNSSIIAKLQPDGTLDTSFATNGIFDAVGITDDPGHYISSVQTLNNGAILATNYDAHGDSYLLRLNSDGSYDTSFGTNGKVALEHGYYYIFSTLFQNVIYVLGDQDSDYKIFLF